MSDPLNEMICFDVYAANLAVGRLYKPLLDELGLTYPQYLALMILWEKDGRAIGEISGILGLESSTLTPLIKRMEATGLVTRRRDDKDERRVHVFLTDAGRKIETERLRLTQCVADATGLSFDEFVQLQGLLRKMRKAIQK
ncbi:MarR family transcriptional regulator [Marivivens niveibacter]|uniref:MarR family transcriptional regulator n=1 Tax=Marivivens niveibacter TaxID=1930667 RepID=A0A251X2B0_9RHOB|nr:MarR family transcriptional regulator [Marivivens niveibacter]OUD10711.1 MarR family transcriptional regulator [Marivivens niveibacter]